MEKYNPINLEFKEERDLDCVINDVKSGLGILLLSSCDWFDEIQKDGKYVDIYDGMAEYDECFNKIESEISKIIDEKPKAFIYEEENKHMNDKYGGYGVICQAKIWETNKYALLYCHEDKELPISIFLVKE